MQVMHKDREGKTHWVNAQGDDDLPKADSSTAFAIASTAISKVYKEYATRTLHFDPLTGTGELIFGVVSSIQKDPIGQAVVTAFDQLNEPTCRQYFLTGSTKKDFYVDWNAVQLVGAQSWQPLGFVEASLQREFDQHVQRWSEDTAYVSSAIEIILHPSYQRIIGMGPAVLPLIFRDLRDNGRDWFWALAAITGDNPVSTADAGNVPNMSHAWLRWGRDHGYF